MTREEQMAAKGLKALLDGVQRTRTGVVKAVDEGTATCTVTIAGDMDLEDVQLQATKESASAVLVVPAVNSNVILLDIGEPDWLVVAIDQIDKVVIRAGVKLQIDCDAIELNGGQNAGVPIEAEIRKNLDAIKDYMAALKAAIEAGLAAVGIGSAANGTTGKTAFSSAMAGQLLKFGDMKNSKVTH